MTYPTPLIPSFDFMLSRLRLSSPAYLALGLLLVSPCSFGAAPTAADQDRQAVPDQVAAAVLAPARTGPSRLRVSNVKQGVTPALIGYNLGLQSPGNNVAPWLRYAEVNAARHWFDQGSWPKPPVPWAEADNRLETFLAARSALRATAAASMAEVEDAIRADQGPVAEGDFGAVHALSQLRQNGIEPLVQLNQNTRRFPFERPDGSPDWHGRWSYWRGVYLLASYLSENYAVSRFQLFNEPDHPASRHISQADYVRRMQIGSDAIHAALADSGARGGKNTTPRIGAPVSAGLLVFEKRPGRPDTRDAETGWGELITRLRKDDFPGRSADYGSLYNVYAFQSYGRDPSRILSGLPRLRESIAALNGGTALPLIVTEMNVSTAANFARTPETLDSPSYYAPFGAVAAAYVNAGIDELYVFRHTQQPQPDGSVKKNGTHLVAADDPLQNIVSSTRGAEVVRLFARGFRGARPRFLPPETEGGTLQAAACVDQSDGTHYLLLTALDRSPDNVAVDLSPWSLAAGSLVTAEEVSETRHGDVASLLALAPDGRLALQVAARSVTLLTVRPGVSGVPFARVELERPAPGRLVTPRPQVGSDIRRAFLALRTSPVARPLQIRSAGANVTQTEIFGQIGAGLDGQTRLVDVTRALLLAPGKTLEFQIVESPEPASGEPARPAEILSAELRLHGDVAR